MKLRSITIKYNASNFADWDGTPPNGYGGKIELDTKVGSVGIILNEPEIAAIVRVIAAKVASDMVCLSQTVDADVRNSLEYNTQAIEVGE